MRILLTQRRLRDTVGSRRVGSRVRASDGGKEQHESFVAISRQSWIPASPATAGWVVLTCILSCFPLRGLTSDDDPAFRAHYNSENCIVLASFDQADEGRFPAGWEARDRGNRTFVRERLPYTVESQDGRTVLHAVYKGRTVTIGIPTPDWNLVQYPHLRWQWRAVELPEEANETISARNDTAAALYVLWEEPFPFFVSGIKYSWSSTLPVGTTASKRFGYDHLYVVESGVDRLNQWSTATVNLNLHSKHFISDPIRQPWGLALMTDADRSPNGAEAYFGSIHACKD